MATTAQEWMEAAAAASRGQKFGEAGDAYVEAANKLAEARDTKQTATAGLCAVTAYIEAGDLEGAELTLGRVERLVVGAVGVEDHVHDSIRTKRLQINHLKAAGAKPAPVAAEAMSHLAPADRSPEEVEDDTPATTPRPLDAQEILDRAKGVGVHAEIMPTGSVRFEEPYKAEADKAAAEAALTVKLVSEQLESVGLSASQIGIQVVEPQHVFGLVLEKPAAA